MSNEIKPKPNPEYELVLNEENFKKATVRKIESVDFKLEDLDSFVEEIEKEKAKHEASATYNQSIIDNIKEFHPEVIEFYNSLVGEKQTAMILFCQATKDLEKNRYVAKNYGEEADKVRTEINEIEQKFGWATPKPVEDNK